MAEDRVRLPVRLPVRLGVRPPALPSLLSGGPLGSRRISVMALHPRQWWTPTARVIACDCVVISSAAPAGP
ncbi:MAG: hypothetical protein ACYCV5_10075, partial [Acidimicrobiales bacterium]